MSEITKFLIDAHIDDLRREARDRARRPTGGRAGRTRGVVADTPVTLRRATASDEPALARLAALDSARVPARPVMVGESNGQLRAALSLSDGATIADPFYPTAAIVELLRISAAQSQDRRRHGIRRAPALIEAPGIWQSAGRPA